MRFVQCIQWRVREIYNHRKLSEPELSNNFGLRKVTVFGYSTADSEKEKIKASVGDTRFGAKTDRSLAITIRWYVHKLSPDFSCHTAHNRRARPNRNNKANVIAVSYNTRTATE